MGPKVAVVTTSTSSAAASRPLFSTYSMISSAVSTTAFFASMRALISS